MFFKLKKYIIQKGLSKKAAVPFDVEGNELFEIKPEDPHEINNSFFMGAHTEAGEDITMRIGKRNGGEHEIFVIYRYSEVVNGEQQFKLLYMEKDHYPAEEIPGKAECVELGKDWRFTFDGYLRDADGKRYKVAFNLLFKADMPIYDFIHDLKEHVAMTTTIARAKWSKDMLSKLPSISQKHYEQSGRMTGTITVEGVSREIDWTGVRDRAMGLRDWDFMNCHIWINCTTDKGEVFMFNIVTFPIMDSLFTGYTNVGRDGYYATLIDYRLIEYDHNDGLASDRVRVMTMWDDGRVMWIDAKRDENVLCTFDNGNYIFQEGLGDVLINSQHARGNLEYGFNKDKSKWHYRDSAF